MKITVKILLVLLLWKLSACVNTRSVQYIQGDFDTASLSRFQPKEPVIQVGDLLSIIVYSDNPEATTLYNLPNVTSQMGAQPTAGYLVDQDGDIQFQGLGKLTVVGMTKKELKALLDSKLTVLLKNPYYNIRFINYKVTLIGEVMREGVYTVPNEKVNILEAIGLAGGLTIYARRDNLMLIREANGKREFARLNLTSPELLKSPYYFLQQNDMIIVEQTRGKAVVNDQVTTRNISLGATIISTLAIIYSLLRR